MFLSDTLNILVVIFPSLKNLYIYIVPIYYAYVYFLYTIYFLYHTDGVHTHTHTPAEFEIPKICVNCTHRNYRKERSNPMYCPLHSVLRGTERGLGKGYQVLLRQFHVGSLH